MKTVEIWGLNVEVEIDETKAFAHETSCGDVYEECYETEQGLIAFDEAVCAYVKL